MTKERFLHISDKTEQFAVVGEVCGSLANFCSLAYVNARTGAHLCSLFSHRWTGLKSLFLSNEMSDHLDIHRPKSFGLKT